MLHKENFRPRDRNKTFRVLRTSRLHFLECTSRSEQNVFEHWGDDPYDSHRNIRFFLYPVSAQFSLIEVGGFHCTPPPPSSFVPHATSKRLHEYKSTLSILCPRNSRYIFVTSYTPSRLGRLQRRRRDVRTFLSRERPVKLEAYANTVAP